MSIKDNLLFSGADCGEDRIKDVIKATCCESVFAQVNDGYNHVISDGGNGFGQYKTRLCIARTILKDSPIYVFDDVFSAYDDAENKTICKNIVSLLPGKTTIFLTNDYNNVKNCDYILKLKKGKVSYFGDSASYNKLQKAGGLHE